MALFYWNKHENKNFERKRVNVSRRSYINCTFEECEIVYKGGPVRLNGCTVTDCTFRFAGKAEDALVIFFMLGKIYPELARSTLIENGLAHLLWDQTIPEGE